MKFLVRKSVLLLGLLIALIPVNSVGEPHLPADDGVVLERLSGASRSSGEAGMLKELRARLQESPEHLGWATELAQLYIIKGRRDSDPRYLGFAQAALRPWWELPIPPVPILVLRATIRQSDHRFESALADLSLALKHEPDNVQALLTRATILQVQGNYREARNACLPLFRVANQLVAVTCASSIGSLIGEAKKSYDLLNRTLSGFGNASVEERVWALTLLAEIAARLGRSEEAEEHFHDALALNHRDSYLFGAYADFLIDEGRSTEVLSLLRNEIRADGLFLRYTLAEENVESEGELITRDIESLGARFEASRHRGSNLHGRSEARYRLHLRNDPSGALEIAVRNWRIQKEPQDARILLESALAAGDIDAAEPVVRWISANRWEDVRLENLVKELVGKL